MKQKLIVIPLDERPCNYNFPYLLTKETEFEIVRPPLTLMGKKKSKGNIDGIWQWLKEEAKNASGVVIAIDTLLYSGIIPSRLHYDSKETLITRLNQIKVLKELYPNLLIYGFNLIMRNPKYSSSDEEPDYYEDWGREIHRYGFINHKISLGIASIEEESELYAINKRLPKEYLDDYLTRREINKEVNLAFLQLVKDKVIDFGIVPQDDSSPYGVTAIDQQAIKRYMYDHSIGHKVYMYPGADEVANVLLIRMINQLKGVTPSVFIRYTSYSGGMIIPLYEDRPLHETVKYQVIACGGIVVSSEGDADLVLIVNAPPSNMVEASEQHKNIIEYDAFRNLVEAVHYANYQIQTLGKKVIFADVAYANGADLALIKLLSSQDLLFKVSGYAGWNTSSNSLGTCIPQGMIHHLYGTTKSHLDFLSLRYTEDAGYCSVVRSIIRERDLPKLGLSVFLVDGERGNISTIVKRELDAFNHSVIKDKTYAIEIEDCYMPWNRTFEVGLFTKVFKKKE